MRKMIVVAIVMVMGASYASAAELISHYAFDGDATNSVAGAPDGTIVGNPQFVTGFDGTVNGALQFDGGVDTAADDYVDTTTSGLPNSTAGLMSGSLAFWIKTSSTAQTRCFGTHNDLVGDGGDSTALQLSLNWPEEDALRLYLRQAGGQRYDISVDETSWRNGEWHHIAFTWDVAATGVAAAYVDGVASQNVTLEDGITSGDAFTAFDNSLYIGAHNDRGAAVDELGGTLDEIRVYDGMLTASEVAALVPIIGTSMTEVITYQSTISSDGNGPLDLVAELNYDTGFVNAPIVVVMHGYSPATGNLGGVRANAQRLRDSGFFAISVAMRGRDGSDGSRDSGGLEIYDIYDAVEHVKSAYSQSVDPDNVHITGYSGGGGNTMSALTKFPDYFRVGSAFFGMSDYGYDHSDGWYFDGASSSHQAQMNTDIGNPTLGDPDVDDKYAARASNLASKNNPYSEIHLFVNYTETTCPPINDTTYRNYAIANESFSGEFDNITAHIGGYGLYEDFNQNGVNEPNELQSWPHGFPSSDQQHAAEGWYLDRLFKGQIPQPVLNSSDLLYVAGYVKTKPFSLWIDEGNNAAAELNYTLASDHKEFILTMLTNNKTLDSEIKVDTSDMAGRVSAEVNGTLVSEFEGGGIFTYSTLKDGDTLELILEPCGQWGYNPMDFNFDCTVNLADFVLFAYEWLKCSDPGVLGCESYN